VLRISSRRLASLLTPVLLSFCFARAIAQDVHVDAAFIRDAIGAQYTSLQDLEAVIHVVAFDAQGRPAYKQEILWLKKGGKEYLEMTTSSPEPNGERLRDIQAWNGERGTTWVTNLTRTNEPGSGRIMRQPPKLLAANIAQRYVLSIQGMSWPEFLRDNPGNLVVGQADSIDLYCMFGSIRTDGLPPDTIRYNACFDPTHNFLPRKWKVEQVNTNGQFQLLDEYEVTKFQKAGALFLPEKLVRRTWNGGHENVDLEIQTNTGIPDAQFEVHWAAGTGIWDDISGVGYYLEGGPKQKVATNEYQREPEEKRTPPRVPDTTDRKRALPEGGFKWFAIGSLTLLLLGVGCAIYWQRRSFRSPK